ncbi:hypothetical protein H5410_002483 [Solanum commersonii]|uniref:Uncharacterized protein n=1 Tax=Solanum commersonii TaxID=4109 RepID=A0A9J6B221_SOLCO|nr:hypothetical protein H5410_002483 [Solanum commersonii]
MDKLRRDFLWFGNKERKGYYLWLWRCVEEEHALWREVIHHKYSQDSRWCTNEVTIPYGVSTWKTIRSFGPNYGKHQTRIGNGAKILFGKMFG